MKKVLIMEDEVNIRSFVVINLQRAGYEVVEAGAGDEALERLQQHPDVGVAILDIMVPGIDGFEVCRRIRATNKQMGVIMLTGLVSVAPDMRSAGNEYFRQQNLCDLRVVSTLGLTRQELIRRLEQGGEDHA